MLAAVLVAGLRQAPAHSATGAGDPAVQQVVDQVVASLTARWQPRSVSVVVVDEGGAVLGRSGPIDTPVVVGSVLKPFTVLAGLQAGVPATSTWSGAALQRGDHTIADHAPRAEVGVRDVLVHSSNVGAVQLAEAAGARRLAEVHQAMGLPAVVVDEAQLPQAAMGLSVAVTPEQLARAYARLAGQSEVIDEALAGAVLRGTAGAARVEGLSVAGKTGTAVSPDGGVVASFVGWGETEGGRRVVAVVVEGPEGDGAYGGSVAAPAFSAVLGGIR
jgi:cell division protein FtsI (penicillin-binding protein 3)